MDQDQLITDEDFVFHKKDGKIHSAGFTIDSVLLEKGKSPMITKNSNIIIGGEGKVSHLFKDLAVPAGLLTIDKHKKYIDDSKKIHKNEPISEMIHEKLLKMVEVDYEKPKKTQKKILKPKKNTKKHRKIEK